MENDSLLKKADSAGCYVAIMLNNHLPGFRVWRDWEFVFVDEKIMFPPIIPDCQVSKKYGNWPFWATGQKIRASTVTLRIAHI